MTTRNDRYYKMRKYKHQYSFFNQKRLWKYLLNTLKYCWGEKWALWKRREKWTSEVFHSESIKALGSTWVWDLKVEQVSWHNLWNLLSRLDSKYYSLNFSRTLCQNNAFSKKLYEVTAKAKGQRTKQNSNLKLGPEALGTNYWMNDCKARTAFTLPL